MAQIRRIMWGICLVLAGVGLLAYFLGFFNIFFDGWWTMFIIIPAGIDLFSKQDKVINWLLVILGVTLLLYQQGIVEVFRIWEVILSLLIIAIGINAIFFRIKKHENTLPEEVKNKEGMNEYTAFFSGTKRVYNNEKFSGAVLSAAFGGINLDLTNAIIEEDVKINVTAILGGCEIRVPKNVNVNISGSNMFGGVDNKIETHDNELPTIYVVSNTIFGGVEIK